MKTRNALISVYHKDGIYQFAQELVELGFTIYASGGTAKHLTNAGVKVTDVATLVGGGPILGHRVVTLSREVHAGLLARDIPEDIEELARLGIPHIDLVCVDLYPLEQEIARPESTPASVIELTDIGGPTMIRSAAKGSRIVICDPSDRKPVIEWLKGDQSESGFINQLCAKAEFVIAKYCMASAQYRSDSEYVGVFGKRVATCKYGENAWQTPAALYSSGTDDPLALDKLKVVEGTDPSYNNLCDVDRLLQTITHIAAGFSVNRGTVPLIAVGAKHGNACGAAIGNTPTEVLERMLLGDPRAIFGGLVMTNFAIDDESADHLAELMHPRHIVFDGIISPHFSTEAIAKLKRKNDKCRFMVNKALMHIDANSLDNAPRFRYVRGGFLRQPNYNFVLNLKQNGLEKHGAASGQELEDMVLAWAIGSTSNSNTITLVKNRQLIGNGVGQQDRIGVAELAVKRARDAGHITGGAVAYSDSFFPFPDGPKVLLDAGITAILTSSASVRDKETVGICAERHATLYMVPDGNARGFFGH